MPQITGGASLIREAKMTALGSVAKGRNSPILLVLTLLIKRVPVPAIDLNPPTFDTPSSYSATN